MISLREAKLIKVDPVRKSAGEYIILHRNSRSGFPDCSGNAVFYPYRSTGNWKIRRCDLGGSSIAPSFFALGVVQILGVSPLLEGDKPFFRITPVTS